MAASDSTPNPIKNQAFQFTFPIHKNDGTQITSASGLDSEISKDNGAFADCTNEATELTGGNGVYYLDLTSTEMNADVVAIVVKSSSTGAVIDSWVFYPWSTGKIKVQLEGITHTSAVIPTVTTTGTATAVTTVNGLAANVITATSIASGAITSAKFAASAIDATAIASNAITSAKIATGAITSSTFAAGAIDASAIAADAIGSSELAATAASEIATAVWALTTRELTAFTFDAGLTNAAVQKLWDWNVGNLVTPESIGDWLVNTSTGLSNRVNTEVLDVLNTDTFAEPSSIPAATTTVVNMIHWMFTLSRNKITSTSTTLTLRNDADSGNIATSTTSDSGGTFTSTEWA